MTTRLLSTLVLLWPTACAPSAERDRAPAPTVLRISDPENVSAAELVGDRRPAFRLAPDSDLEWELILGEGDRLRYSVAVPEGPGAEQPEIGFQVRFAGRQGHVLLDEIEGIQPGEPWRDREVTIPRHLAGPGTLLFEVRSETPVETALSDPRVLQRGLEDESRPNLLIYLIDTLRPDHLSCYGAAERTSPRIDGLAEQGYRFANFYAVAPWTRPTTATLLTGASPESHGMGQELPLARSFVTLAEILAGAGYSTWAAVANPQVGARALGFDQGFQRFVTTQATREEGDRDRAPPTSEQLNRTILPWIEALCDEPFLLYVHSMDPHAPYTPGPGADGPFGRSYRGPLRHRSLRPGLLRLLSKQMRDPERAFVRDAYDNEIRYQDAQLGRLLDALETRGLLEQTIVIVISDHGEEFQEHGNWGHGYRMWEELLRVPFVLRIPERYRRGLNPVPAAVPEIVSQLDFLPGLLDLLGLEARDMLSGRSWLPLLSGAPAEPNPLFAIDYQSWKGDEIGAYRVGNTKLLWCKGDGETLIERLFDLETDAREQHDLSRTRPDLLDRMRALRDRHQRESERLFPMPGPRNKVELSERLRAELRQLGYVRSNN